METTIRSNKPSFYSSNSPLFPLKSIELHQRIRPRLQKRSRAIRLSAKKDIHGGDFSGPMVDKDMFMLRRRMHEMEVAESKLEAKKCWMEWERECYDKYCSGVCGFVGLVQLLLMNSRPSVAIAMLILFMSSVPASVIMVFLHLGGICH